MNKLIHIGFLGCGNIGCGVYNLLKGFKNELIHRTGCEFSIKRILVRNMNKVRGAEIDPALLTTDVNDLLNDDEISIILEFLGGEEPAHEYVCRALAAGKTVVTANKVAFALHWHEMQKTAQQSGAGLYYEAAVCGAIPIIHALEESLQANRINLIYGIVNGTTNYILTRMSRDHMEYKDALAQAQQLGLAEPDPSSDVEGLDAAYKLSILSTLAFHGRIPFENVYVEGITNVSSEDIECGHRLGYTLKLLAVAKRDGMKVESRVHPTFISNHHPMANVSDSFNAVFLHGHACNDMMFMGRGAGDMPTASAIVSDLLRASNAIKHSYPTFQNDPNPAVALQNNTDWNCAFYTRMLATDAPGVLSRITQTFAEHQVSIAAMQQMGALDGKATLVFITHKASEKDMQAALREIPEDMAEVKSLIRVEED